ncbi:MAG: MutS-related protein [Vulcanimicrobiaceae bacterium]
MISILFAESPANGIIAGREPEFFSDLNLDHVVTAIVAQKEQYDLKPFFYTALSESESVAYRQNVFQDLEDAQLLENIRHFASRMRDMSAHIAQAKKTRNTYEADAWFLEAIAMYCDAVRDLSTQLDAAALQSAGFERFRQYLATYIQGETFRSLVTEKEQVEAQLSDVRYSILIQNGGFSVLRYDNEADYSAVVDETFEKFRRSAVTDYLVKFKDFRPEMNHIEAQILVFVAKLFPDQLGHLDRFCNENRVYIDEVVARFEREVQFYVSYLEYVDGFRRAGLSVCYPVIAEGADKAIACHDTFDMALAQKLIGAGSSIVGNEFSLEGAERMIVVTGPNQGGKTTFARTFGQVHYLAALGCPIAGADARLYLFDRLFTHFEREESIENLRGKLEDDLHRLHEIIEATTSSSIVILNEIFTSTTIHDAVFLSRHVMEQLLAHDGLGVWVTFIDELSNLSPKTVSMVSTVVPDQPAMRTFKVVRRPADGLAYALSIAERYKVTYSALLERLPS